MAARLGVVAEPSSLACANIYYSLPNKYFPRSNNYEENTYKTKLNCDKLHARIHFQDEYDENDENFYYIEQFTDNIFPEQAVL